MDCDNARATALTAAKLIPEGYDVDYFQYVLIAGTDPKDLSLDMLSLASWRPPITVPSGWKGLGIRT